MNNVNVSLLFRCHCFQWTFDGGGVLTRYTSHSRRRDGVMVDATRLREVMRHRRAAQRE